MRLSDYDKVHLVTIEQGEDADTRTAALCASGEDCFDWDTFAAEAKPWRLLHVGWRLSRAAR
jgi:hypothetical protein